MGEAEEVKRRLEDQLAGRIPTIPQQNAGQPIDTAVKLFLQDKTTWGLSAGVLGKYSRELERLQKYCESAGAFVVQAITKELLSDYCATWTELYPSTATRAKCARALQALPPLLLRGAMAHPRAHITEDQSGRTAHDAARGGGI